MQWRAFPHVSGIGHAQRLSNYAITVQSSSDSQGAILVLNEWRAQQDYCGPAAHGGVNAKAIVIAAHDMIGIGIGIGIVALAHASMAQTSAAPAKAGTRLITLGTAAGASPRAHRAQSSNLLIVNGALYVIDAGDSVARRAGLYPE